MFNRVLGSATMRNFQKTGGDFPVGTLMAYGPDARRATKLVAAIIDSPASDPVALKRWFVAKGDIRNDREVQEEITAFFKAHRPRRTVNFDRIGGCPHEEGVDYPLGAVCPECPFWAETDRFTHGPKAPVADASTERHIPADEILVALSEERGCPPKAALASADVRRAELTDALLEALDVGLADPETTFSEDAHLFCHALLLLAKWREPRAFPPVLRWLALPDEGAHEIAGDLLPQTGSRILASVCTGGADIAAIQALVENPDADEHCRVQALESLAVLVAWGELPRETVIAYLRELITEKLGREPHHIWDGVAWTTADLGAAELVPLLRQPYDDGWIDSFAIGWDELEDRTQPGGRPLIEDFQRSHPPITDVARETSWWSLYSRSAPEAPPKPAVAEQKPGRNDQCPCGSGKKYKKCCGKEA